MILFLTTFRKNLLKMKSLNLSSNYSCNHKKIELVSRFTSEWINFTVNLFKTINTNSRVNPFRLSQYAPRLNNRKLVPWRTTEWSNSVRQRRANPKFLKAVLTIENHITYKKSRLKVRWTIKRGKWISWRESLPQKSQHPYQRT